MQGVFGYISARFPQLYHKIVLAISQRWVYNVRMYNEIHTTTDEEGDTVLSIVSGDMMVFATLGTKVASISFGVASEVARGGMDWMDTMTGRGAFATIRVIRDAVASLIAEVQSMGFEYHICCDSRRAKLYGRYLPTDRITVI